AQPTDTDMRKQYDGLAALAKNKMQGQLDAHHLFVFINRRRTQIKVLYYSAGGLCLWAKRLEKGQFQVLEPTQTDDQKLILNAATLHCLIDGIKWSKAPQHKRFGSVMWHNSSHGNG
ncbi:MAG: IS66 family insertion sequence element accessory protein TnpB, partial [Limnobacter sp.]|nr:IS66 family insertion sequence element accessory protein TnpB [Limnobacter sp.]